MISAFTIYLVMQADGVSASLFIIGSCMLIWGGICWAFYSDLDEFGNERKIYSSWKLAMIGIALLAIAAAVPSTKTAAAMLIVPAITSESAIEMASPEARELYELTKGALRSFGDKCPKEARG